MTHTAFIFPGQGSQTIGMGKALYDAFPVAKETFQEVDDALSQPLSQIIFEGPEDALTATANTQPALMAVSIAALRVLLSESNLSLNHIAKYVAGHSLGEYTALTAAGTFSLSDCAKLLRIRGDAMQAAVPRGEGAMAALIGIEFEDAKRLSAEVTNGGTCQAANDNGGGQVVISGSAKAIQAAIDRAPEFGVKKAVLLPVSAPFHSSLMAPAATRMAEALAEVAMHAPSIPVIANVTAQAETDPAVIRDLLVKQVTGTVRWRESVEYMVAQQIDTTIEVGAGKVLSGLVKRIHRPMNCFSLGTPEEIDAWLKQAA